MIKCDRTSTKSFYLEAQAQTCPLSTNWNLVLVFCWCQFTVGSTCEAAKNQFAFPQLERVREPRHSVTVYVSMDLCFLRNTSASFITTTVAHDVRPELLLLAFRGFSGIHPRLLRCETFDVGCLRISQSKQGFYKCKNCILDRTKAV